MARMTQEERAVVERAFQESGLTNAKAKAKGIRWGFEAVTYGPKSFDKWYCYYDIKPRLGLQYLAEHNPKRFAKCVWREFERRM